MSMTEVIILIVVVMAIIIGSIVFMIVQSVREERAFNKRLRASRPSGSIGNLSRGYDKRRKDPPEPIVIWFWSVVLVVVGLVLLFLNI